MKTLVMKFGGTSVGNEDAIARAAEIVRVAQKDSSGQVVIVSAMSGVTDLLLKGAHTAANGDRETFRAITRDLHTRHETAINSLLDAPAERQAVRDRVQFYLTEYENFCHAVNILGEATPRALDAIASLGERMSIQLVAGRLRQTGLSAEAIESTELIITDDCFGAANPLMDKTKARTEKRLRAPFNQGVVLVITGFIGATESGAITTLGRGGSDYSAAILGAALEVEAVWIWTDVNGVMTADPRVVPDAQTLPELSFREISELAYYGAKVVHPKTIRPVIERGIDLRIKSTFNPSHSGTRIVPDDHHVEGTIKAVTAIKGQSMITVEGRGMLGVPGVAARTFGAVARTGASVTLITQASSEQSICFTVPADLASRVLTALQDEFRFELLRRDIDSVTTFNDAVIVTVVGAGMRHTPGVAGKVCSTLGNSNVNIIAIAQGSSECSISLVVEAKEADEAVRAIHQLVVMRKT